mmetsp:Transcript_15146/g.47100  ORF Transcript_15146/g.47100 Transcript_15146/m.47100 type:complete len:271 (+) Transcript_15146:1665-2477(+)
MPRLDRPRRQSVGMSQSLPQFRHLLAKGVAACARAVSLARGVRGATAQRGQLHGGRFSGLCCGVKLRSQGGDLRTRAFQFGGHRARLLARAFARRGSGRCSGRYSVRGLRIALALESCSALCSRGRSLGGLQIPHRLRVMAFPAFRLGLCESCAFTGGHAYRLSSASSCCGLGSRLGGATRLLDGFGGLPSPTLSIGARGTQLRCCAGQRRLELRRALSNRLLTACRRWRTAEQHGRRNRARRSLGLQPHTPAAQERERRVKAQHVHHAP